MIATLLGRLIKLSFRRNSYVIDLWQVLSIMMIHMINQHFDFLKVQ